MSEGQRLPPAFEIVCLGAGGGPLEGDVLGYMCKPYANRWDQGWLGLEGGCGIGALTALLHQAILTKVIRQMHQASAKSSSVVPTHPGFSRPLSPDPSTQTPGSADSHVPPQTPPVTASMSDGADIRTSFNSKPPRVMKKLGIAGQEQVHVEEEILFPGVEWPEDYQTPVLKAAWLFSHLTSFLVTHAHFDHILSLVLSTGSLPMPPASPASKDPSTIDKTCPSIHSARRPIYASLSTLKKIEKVYQGDVWPELGCWSEAFPSDLRSTGKQEHLLLTETGLVDHRAMAEAKSGDAANAPQGLLQDGITTVPGKSTANIGSSPKARRRSSLLASLNSTLRNKNKQRRNSKDVENVIQQSKSVLPDRRLPKDVSVGEVEQELEMQQAYEVKAGVGVQYCPTPAYPVPQRLPLRSAVSATTGNALAMSVLELPVSHGTTTQGNYEASAFFIRLSQDPTQSAQIASEEDEAEILFFGDIESSHTGPVAERLNKEVWKVAAEKWAKGTLRAIFIECSYTGSRPKHLMFGHLAPPCIFGELEVMVSFLPKSDKPLEGLRIYIQHIKEPLIPEEPIKQKIGRELEELEEQHQLGVQFVCLARGMRILI